MAALLGSRNLTFHRSFPCPERRRPTAEAPSSNLRFCSVRSFTRSLRVCKTPATPPFGVIKFPSPPGRPLSSAKRSTDDMPPPPTGVDADTDAPEVAAPVPTPSLAASAASTVSPCRPPLALPLNDLRLAMVMMICFAGQIMAHFSLRCSTAVRDATTNETTTTLFQT